MRYEKLIEPENRQALKKLYTEYYNLLNEYRGKGLEPPPKEMAQKLNLHIDEYSLFLIDVQNDGYKNLIDEDIQNDINNGAETINELWK